VLSRAKRSEHYLHLILPLALRLMLLFYEFPVVVVSMMMMMLFLRVFFVIVAHSPPYDDHDTGRRTEEKEGESPETGNKRGEPQMDPQNSSFIPKDRNP
jgi:hypothetical protein